MNVDILTVSEDSENPYGVINSNFRRMADAIKLTREADTGADTVTGSLTIATSLALVSAVVATLNGAPIAGAAFVSADIVSASSIRLRVWTSAFAASVTPIVVNWIALGE